MLKSNTLLAVAMMGAGLLALWPDNAEARRCRGGGPGCGGGGPGGGYGPGGGMGRVLAQPEMLESMAVELGLEPATLAKIKDLLYEANRVHIDQKAGLRHAHLELRRVLDQDQPDTATVMKMLDNIGQLETEARKNRIALLLNVRALLTPEQRQKFRSLVGRTRGPGGRGPGSGRGPWGGPGTGQGPDGLMP